ncbi:hypothetical protein NP493_829g01087 [Ridgeia piscesae]|uniref:LITAF domain-containing protein n=1 Tax=Ridgeia piscesae TaxID=27915 RepID=A0AAD9KMI5_RIDPI|nr:hypothetical protein NP493_829g01087 [Ridgeia piscesae]
MQPVSVVAVVQEFRNSPVQTVCPYCRRQIATVVTFETGTFTWVVALVTFLIGCTLGCCCMPFCLNSCKDAIHTCPICNQQIFKWRRL